MSIHDRMKENPASPDLGVDDVLLMLGVKDKSIVEQAAAVQRAVDRGELGEISLCALRDANWISTRPATAA